MTSSPSTCGARRPRSTGNPGPSSHHERPHAPAGPRSLGGGAGRHAPAPPPPGAPARVPGVRPVGVRRGYYVESGEDAIVMWVEGIDLPKYEEVLNRLRAAARGGERNDHA